MARFFKAIRSGDAKGRSNLPLYVGKMDDEELLTGSTLWRTTLSLRT